MWLFYVISILVYFHLKGIYSFLNKEEIEVSFALIKELEIRQCILAGPYDNSVSVIKKFSSVYIQITYLNYGELDKCVDRFETVYFRTGIILKDENFFALEEILRIFKKTNATYKLQNFIWLTFIGNEMQHFQSIELSIPYDCEFIVIQSKNERTYKFTEIYTINTKLFSLDFGIWDRNFGLQVSNQSFYCRRFDFQKSEIRVLSKNPENGDWNVQTQLMYDLVSGFANIMNITYRSDYYEVKSAETFFQLQEIGDILLHIERFGLQDNTFDELGPIFKALINWYVKYPRKELRPDYYLKPFDIHFWLALLFAVLLGTVITFIFQKFDRSQKRYLIDNLFLSMESFCNQCGNNDIENAYLRLICILLRSTALISISLYGAIITSFFAVKISQPPFTNLEGFLANGEYQVVTADVDYMPSLLRVEDNVLYKKVYENFTKHVGPVKYGELIQNICLGKYVTYGVNNEINSFTVPCNIFQIPEYFGSFWYGMLLRKNSCFTKIFNENLIRFYENGVLTRFKKYITDNPPRVKDAPFQPIKMEHMTQVLSIPVMGILIGTAIIVFEILNKRRCLRKNYSKI